MTASSTHLFSKRQDDFVLLSLRRITPVMCLVVASVNSFCVCGYVINLTQSSSFVSAENLFGDFFLFQFNF